MKFRLSLLAAAMIAVAAAPDCMALTGRWRGELNAGMAKLPLVFSFSENAQGVTTATMDSPKQNARGIALDVVYASADSINVECRMIRAAFAGNVSGGKITGIFTQNGFRLPLTLEPEHDEAMRRPQTPRPPFPYAVKDTVFRSNDGIELAGTLTLPAEARSGKVPVVVMVTGSGPQNRDEELFGHRPFAVIADYLGRNGIASLRYDDRGTAQSKGDYGSATVATFKADAESALRFVRSFPEFGEAGVLGHSEGGTIAMLLADDAKPDFIVSLAGMAVPAKELLLAQNEHALDRAGFTGGAKEASLRLLDILFDSIRSQYAAGVSSPIDVDALCRDNEPGVPPAVLESARESMKTRNAYFDSFLSLDPTESLRRVKCPVLAINGTKDTQVNADANLAAFEKYVGRADVRRMNGLNHLMQHAQTGEAGEYGEISETIAPEVLALIAEFIRQSAN